MGDQTKKKRYAINKSKYLEDDECLEFERVLNKFIDSSPRDCVLLLTLLYTGGRASEVLAIRPADISDGTVLIRGLKGSDDREVPIPPCLFKRLKRLADERQGKGPVFPITYNRLVQIWQNYRPVEKKLHSLRHTCAIRQLRKHGQLDIVMKLLGHRNIQNTMVYANYAYTKEEFRKKVL